VLRKQPGDGLDTTHRMARANSASIMRTPDGSRQCRFNPLNGVAQANLQFKRCCASSPVTASTQHTGWLAPNTASIPLNGVAQAARQFKRCCASSPVSASTQLTGWLAPFRFNSLNGVAQANLQFKRCRAISPVTASTQLTGWLAPIPLQFLKRLRASEPAI